MPKFQFLLRAPDDQKHWFFAERFRGRVAERLLACEPERLILHLTEKPPPRLTVIPFKRRPLAMVSVWAEDPAPFERALAGTGDLTGYRVRESTPVAYQRDWPDGRPTPGIGLLTLMNRKPGMSDEAFMHEWHGRHTPKSLRIHPLWHYVRNEPVEPVVRASPHFDGIVEEHFRTRSDLLNPVRFFGGPLRFLPQMVEVGLHVNSFLDARSLETYLVTEIHLKS